MAGTAIPFNKIAPTDMLPRSMVQKLPLIDARVWDAPMSALPTSAANDDLGLVAGTWGTAAPTITAGDVKATSSTRYARLQYVVPEGFNVHDSSLTLRINAGMATTVSDTSCTVDAVVYENTGATISSDLCTTAAMTMNSLTAADKDFTITSSSLVAGDVLDIRLAVAYVDAATGTAVTPTIYGVSMVASIRS